jgi:hypothetical protein
MLFRAACFAILVSASGLTRAEEKYWIAHQADLIVIGTMHPNFTFPWLDGWHLTGTIDVEEVLFGPPQPSHITYRFVCEYAWCRNWPPPRFDAFFREKGIWFLRPLDRQEWRPSTGVGFAALWARYDFEDYIRRYKETRPTTTPSREASPHDTEQRAFQLPVFGARFSGAVEVHGPATEGSHSNSGR